MLNYKHYYVYLIIFLTFSKYRVFSAAVVNVYQSDQRLIDNQLFYEYRYAVEDPISGVISEKWESRLGDYVKGRYSFLQADGLVRTVHYESDSVSGFRAIVQTTNPASSYLTSQNLI
ncbi:cuticle protein 19-like [Planococcus citri]|uniref:cuticle protein 19-like n=1 Tax=Planococcus citri TaxID=170843 RepID=UPI0031FA22BC